MKKKASSPPPAGRDLRRSGLLTYRGLRLTALIAMTISQLCAIMQFAARASVILG